MILYLDLWSEFTCTGYGLYYASILNECLPYFARLALFQRSDGPPFSAFGSDYEFVSKYTRNRTDTGDVGAWDRSKDLTRAVPELQRVVAVGHRHYVRSTAKSRPPPRLGIEWIAGHAWQYSGPDTRIAGRGPKDLLQPELKHLAAVWLEQRERLETLDAFVRFNERLHREWAIETGLIERLYSFDRGVTQLLIERGIDAALIPHGDDQQPESVAAMIQDHQAAVESIFRFVRGERILTTGYVKEMHALMTRNQAWAEAADVQGRISRVELIRGDYKRRPTIPCDPTVRSTNTVPRSTWPPRWIA